VLCCAVLAGELCFVCRFAMFVRTLRCRTRCCADGFLCIVCALHPHSGGVASGLITYPASLFRKNLHREKNAKTARRLSDLSTNVANALGKKLDVRDYKRLAKDHNLDLMAKLGRPHTHTSHVNTSSAAVQDTSRHLSGYPDGASDANREFDSLLRTMRDPDSAEGYISDEFEETGFPAGATGAEFTPAAAGKQRATSAGRGHLQATPYRQTPGVQSG
jgi:hypothetical protein